VDIIYQERVPFPFVRRVVTVCIALILAFSITYCYLRLNGLLGDHPASLGLFLAVLSAMVAVTLILANLVTLSIKMTEESAVVGFGIFRARVRWEDVRGCDLDRLSSFVSAANWGVSMGFVGGWWRRMYNVKGCPRVVLEMKRGRKALVFSTKNPDAVMDVVKGRIGK
jgi:hypothetical protein